MFHTTFMFPFAINLHVCVLCCLMQLTDPDPMALEEKLTTLTSSFLAAGHKRVYLAGTAPPTGIRKLISRRKSLSGDNASVTAPFSGSKQPPYGTGAPGRRDAGQAHAQRRKHKSVIVSGQALAYILGDDNMQAQFLTIAMNCKAVVACRVSPPQKASLVRMVRAVIPSHK